MKKPNSSSKKVQKEENSKRRTTWGDYGSLNPVTKVIPNKKKESKKNAYKDKIDEE